MRGRRPCQAPWLLRFEGERAMGTSRILLESALQPLTWADWKTVTWPGADGVKSAGGGISGGNS